MVSARCILKSFRPIAGRKPSLHLINRCPVKIARIFQFFPLPWIDKFLVFQIFFVSHIPRPICMQISKSLALLEVPQNFEIPVGDGS